MTRLIDADHLKWNLSGIKCGTLSVNYLNYIIDNEEPTVDAIPVELIQKRIEYLRELANYAFDTNGGYVEHTHMRLYELEELLEIWEERKRNGTVD